MRFTSDYTAGPLFWNIAENAIAIIGACLPTLAPLWGARRHMSKDEGSYTTRFPQSELYNRLESTHNKRRDPDEDSINRLIGWGTATKIQAEEIALEDRAQEGIKVHTILDATNHSM